jgi:hypothetical protein
VSVALLLEYPGTSIQSRMVPIATEEIFTSYWLPASQALGLEWIPVFQSGVTVSQEDSPSILAELERLKTFVTHEWFSHLPEGMANHITERINLLRAELQIIWDEPNVEVYIG